jgi:hypothetical protein
VRQEAATQLEAMRHEFARELEAHKVRFARLQEKRLEPLVFLFSSVARLCSQVAVARAVSDQESDGDWTARIDRLRSDAVNALRQYHAARVYLPGPLAERIQSLIVSVRRGILRHRVQAQQQSPQAAREAFNEVFSDDYNAQAENLAVEFRSLLGVEDAVPRR